MYHWILIWGLTDSVMIPWTASFGEELASVYDLELADDSTDFEISCHWTPNSVFDVLHNVLQI